MAKITRQSAKKVTRDLGFRVTPREEILLNRAAEIRERSRNFFITNAALQAARDVLKEAGVDESSLFDKAARSTRNTRAKAA